MSAAENDHVMTPEATLRLVEDVWGEHPEPCNALCAEFGIGHPTGPFCVRPEDESEIARVAVRIQLHSAAVSLSGLGLDVEAWLKDESQCHSDEFKQLLRRTRDAVDGLLALAQPKPKAG